MNIMIKLLGGSLWQFVGVILAFLAIVVTVLIYLLQRTRKSLSYEFVSNIPLLTIREELEGKLQVLFESNYVKNVQLLIIRLFNSGNVSISSTDYERPLQFVFGESVKILSAEIINKSPDDIIASVSINKDKIEFAPALLNSKDSITVKALVSNYKESPKAEARIIGVKGIKEITSLTFEKALFIISLAVVFSMGLFVCFSVADSPILVIMTCVFIFCMFGLLYFNYLLTSKR